jgi:2-dehydropantoate 2-reductase
MKIATMATGGIGGFLAARLAKAGHEVATIARGAHLAAIRENGLTLEAFDGTLTVRPWKVNDDPAEVGPVDAVIFGVKANDLDSAAEACRPMLGPETVVVPFLNGVEAAERLAAILPPQNVGNGVAYISTTISAPGVITQTGEFNRFVFAERDSTASPRIEALRDAINEAGSNAPPSEDIDRELWQKFVLFAAVSGVTSAARCTLGDVVANAALGEVFRAAVGEAAAVGFARGVDLPKTIAEDTWALVQSLPPAMRASTAIDVEKGRPLEIDWLSGAVVRLSVAAGLDAPVNRMLYALLLPHRDGHES